MAEANVIIQEGGERGDIDHQLLGVVKTISVAQKEELLGSITEQPSVKRERSVSPHMGLSPYVLKEIPKLPVFSSTDNDATHVRRHPEVKCPMEKYTECDVVNNFSLKLFSKKV